MSATARPAIGTALAVALTLVLTVSPAQTGPKEGSYWQIDEIRPGMRGVGRTVMKGTKIESFDAEVLGVLKNTSPGRDMILCRLSGLNLEHTGVIAGMSGSPIYIDGKLLGAVAYAWPYGKEPIAGVTPFSQMHGFVESFERRDLVEQNEKPNRIGLHRPLTIDGMRFETVTVSTRCDNPKPTAADGLWMVPLQTPICSSGFTPHTLSLMSERFRSSGLLPVMGGGAVAHVVEAEADTPLQAGGPLAVALVTGDFDMSGIGTVTHIEGSRVYGWGHPFMGMGNCEFPLMTGYIHTIYPRQSVSFKMGSPLRTVGVINADVSTGIAGWLERRPDLMPIRMTVSRDAAGPGRTFNVRVVRQRSLLAAIVYACLTNSIDMEGELPEELTAEMNARIDIEGHDPIIIKDTFSGSSYSGGRAPQALYHHLAGLVNLLAYNAYRPVRIQRIECETHVVPGRSTADIEAVQLDSDTFMPGETLRGTVFLRPYKGLRQSLPVKLKLPADLPEGTYTATVCDDLANARLALHDNPTLNNPQNLDQLFEAVHLQTAAKRTNLVVRVPVKDVGVALQGQALPDLPASMVHILGNTRRTGAQAVSGALVSREPTPWVVQGVESVRFQVVKHKRGTVNAER
jgi:hypothetical protein